MTLLIAKTRQERRELKMNVKEPALVEGLLLASGVSNLVGRPKAGKSVLLHQLAIATAKGGEWLGRAVRKGKALLVALEDCDGYLDDHLNLLGWSDEDPLLVHTGDVEGKTSVRELEKLLESDPEIRLVILDTLYDFMDLDNANDYVEIGKLYKKLKALAAKYNVHFICSKHANKRKEGGHMIDSDNGSAKSNGAVSTVLTLSEDERTGIRSYSVRGRYAKAVNNVQLVWDEATESMSIGVQIATTTRLTGAERRERCDNSFIEYIRNNPGVSQKDLLAEAGCGTAQERRDVLEGITSKHSYITMHGKGVRHNPFQYFCAAVPYETPDVGSVLKPN